MSTRLGREIAGILGIPVEDLTLAVENRNPQPHAHAVVRVLEGRNLRAVAKLPRSGSGAFFLRRERLIVEWLRRRCPAARALRPLAELTAHPRPGLLYPPAGEPAGTREVVAWLRGFQEASAETATIAGARRALSAWRPAAAHLPAEARAGYAAARERVLDAAREERLRTVVRHGDPTRENVRSSGEVIDWAHFRRASLPQYDPLYLTLAELGAFAGGCRALDGPRPDLELLLSRVVERSAPGLRDPGLARAGLALSAAELAYQSRFRTRVGRRYGDWGDREVDRRLLRVAAEACRSYPD